MLIRIGDRIFNLDNVTLIEVVKDDGELYVEVNLSARPTIVFRNNTENGDAAQWFFFSAEGQQARVLAMRPASIVFDVSRMFRDHKAGLMTRKAWGGNGNPYSMQPAPAEAIRAVDDLIDRDHD